MPHYVQEQLTLGAVQDLNQVAYGLLPYVESMLARTAGANVLAIAGKAALLPGGPKWKICDQTNGFKWLALSVTC